MKRKLLIQVIILTLLLGTACKNKGDDKVTKERNSHIGIWYSVWYAYEDPKSTETQINTWASWDIQYDVLLPDGTYGKYDSLDEEVIFFHLEQMADLGIDFVILDQTNHIDVENGYINRRALKFVKCLEEWNSNEENRRIRYASAIGAIQWSNSASSIESEAKILWDRYCSQSFGYEDNHYYLEDKPLLIVYGDGGEDLWTSYQGNKTYGNLFTIRYADNQSSPGRYGWAFDKGTQLDEEVVVIMPGWNNRKGAPIVLREEGKWYKGQWNLLLKSDLEPKIIILNSFNEYAENTGLFPADTTNMDNGIERWTDSKGNITKDLYWEMTRNFIKEYRGG